MNFFDLLATLWRLRIAALVLGLVAAICAVLFTFSVSLSPFRLRPRALQLGVAQTQLLVDTGTSPLADAATPLHDLSPLAENFSQLIHTPIVLQAIAKAISVTPSEIGVDEQLNQNVPLTVKNTREPQRGIQLLASQQRYYVLVRTDQSSLVLQIYTQAPSGGQAIRMANAAADALARYVNTLARSQPIPLADRIILRRLSSANGGTVYSGASRDAAILIGIALWVFGLIALLTLRRVRATRHDLSSPPADPASAPRL